MSVYNYSQDWSDSLAAMMQHKVSLIRSERYNTINLKLDDILIMTSSLEEYGEKGMKQVEAVASRLALFFQTEIDQVDGDLAENNGRAN